MPLWLAAVLFVIAAAVLAALGIHTRRNGKRAWTIAAIAVSGAVLLGALLYAILTFLFVDVAYERPPMEPPATLANARGAFTAPPETPAIPVETTETAVASPIPTSTVLPAASPEPDEYDLPTSEVPALDPDVLGLRSVLYEEMPVFGSQNEVAKFVLHNFLNDRFEFEFYLTKGLAADEGTGYVVLNRACEVATAYYQFSAYSEYDMFTEDRREGSADRVYAKIKLIYTEPEYDLEARAEALEFVRKNPVPVGGFTDFASEKDYARKIHDFIARKITYSPIGYDPESMIGMRNHEALQEAYNVLAETENTAVCAGYARAFALIAQYAGINAAWVRGNETETQSHAWNVIYPCDGSGAVLVDVTWDDTGSGDWPEQESVSDKYFYIPLNEEREHTATEQFDGFLRFINKG